jgi:hypothetical protein
MYIHVHAMVIFAPLNKFKNSYFETIHNHVLFNVCRLIFGEWGYPENSLLHITLYTDLSYISAFIYTCGINFEMTNNRRNMAMIIPSDIPAV